MLKLLARKNFITFEAVMSMASPKSKRQPRRRNESRVPVNASEHLVEKATGEITDKLQEIAQLRERHQHSDGEAAATVAVSLGIELRGAQVVNRRLFSEKTAAASTEVISIQSTVDPAKPDCISIRMDGWNGYLILTLPWDCAALLAKKIEQAVELAHSPNLGIARPLQNRTRK